MLNRKKAMLWWNKLPITAKENICINNIEILGDSRKWEFLTGREIEILFNKVPQISKEEFDLLLDKCFEIHKNYPDLRLGQIIWNEFNKVYPKLVEPLRSSEVDPFYKEKSILEFFEAITTQDVYESFFDKNIY